MIKFLHRLLVGLGAVTIIGIAVAVADYVIKDGAGATQTVLAFTCATTKICPASVPITSAGVEIAVATAANQATEIASLASIDTKVGSSVPACGTNPCVTVIGAFTQFQGTAALSATNGAFTNLLQGNAVLSATNPLPVNQTSQYPVGATPITASATGTTGATTATLAGTSGKTTYICGYSIRANATAAITVTNTITGVITATLSSVMWVAPLASGLGVDEQIFIPCIPASGTNQAIAVVSGAPGSGGAVSSKGWGYQL